MDDVQYWVKRRIDLWKAQVVLWWRPKRERLKDHKRALGRWMVKRDKFVVGAISTLIFVWIWSAITNCGV